MKIISHRGNIKGPQPQWENRPSYIDCAIGNGYDVEVDVRYVAGGLWLGHDYPKYEIDLEWLLLRRKKIWIHTKNYEAMVNLVEYDLNLFWHQEDDIVLTSKKFIWAYPGKQPIKKSIAVLPELNNDDVSSCKGICSDYILKYKTL